MVHRSKRKFSNVGLPNNLLGAIGHVTALWAQLEFIIDHEITRALTLPGAPKANPQLIVPFNQRLELLDKLCKQYLTNPDNLTHAAKIVADLKLLIGQRNLIIHGSVAHSKQRRHRQVVYWFRRIRWDDPRRIIERRALTVAQVEAFAMKVSDHVAYAGMIEVFFWSVHDALRGKDAQ